MPKNHYKPGTAVLVRGIVVGEYNPDDGNASVSVRLNTHMDYGRNILFSPDKLEKVKPASNRRFRKGDKVRLIYRGRKAPEGLRYDKIYTVTENETAYGLCRLTDGVANYSCLELVEAVEESFDIPFHEAVYLMGEGKILERINHNDIFQYRLVDGNLQYLAESEKGNPKWRSTKFCVDEINAKWRIVK